MKLIMKEQKLKDGESLQTLCKTFKQKCVAKAFGFSIDIYARII